MKFIFYILPLLAGVAMSVQAGVNSQLRTILSNPILAAFISFVTGSLALMILLFFSKKGLPPVEIYSSISWYKYIGGLLGVIVVVSVILSVPKIGAANMFVLIIAGQLVTAVILDHYGFLGMKPNAVSFQKVAGMLFLIVGAYLVNKK
jgi:bacterial/archaeal transporter family-2 protein